MKQIWRLLVFLVPHALCWLMILLVIEAYELRTSYQREKKTRDNLFQPHRIWPLPIIKSVLFTSVSIWVIKRAFRISFFSVISIILRQSFLNTLLDAIIY